MEKVELTVYGNGNKDAMLASSVCVYIPKKIREAAGFRAGDRFEIGVVNNKVKFRYNPDGEVVLPESFTLSIKAAYFEPPIKRMPSTPVQCARKGEWLAFQIPPEFEYIEKGFQLLEKIGL